MLEAGFINKVNRERQYLKIMKDQRSQKHELLSQNKWFDDFINPPMAYHPVPFWSWNETMEPKEIKNQMNLMAEAGMGGGFVHSRIGLTTPYMSKQWFEAVDATVEQARQLGQNVWLYDEDKWPSGFAGGAVPLADKSFRVKALIARQAGTPFPDETQIEPVGKPTQGIQIYVWTAPLGHNWFNGTCYTDMMDRSAIRHFLDQAYEPYYQRYGDDYGQLICAEFTDEPCTIFRGRIPVGAVPYSNELFDCFSKTHGYDPIEKLHLLFIEQPGAERFRLDYFRTINDMFENNFSAQLGQWCSDHKIDLTGHYMSEESLYAQQLWGVKIMPNYRHQGIPGIDHLGRQINERISAKQCHSVVNQYGKKRMLSELYGCSGGGLSFEDRFWIASQQICLGVNLLNPHLSLYTMAGCRKRDYPPNLFYQQPWWPVNKEVDEPLSRFCVALSQGQYHAEALIIHPQESALALWTSKYKVQDINLTGSNGEWDREPTIEGVKDDINQLDTQVKAVMNTLLANQHTFDFGDETILAKDGKVVALESCPHLRVGQMDYPVIILPSMITIAESTFELLKEFQNAGGAIFRCGQKPQLLDGSSDADLVKWIDSVPEVPLSHLSSKMRSVIIPSVELLNRETVNTEMLWSHTRNLENGERLIFLVNLHRLEGFNAEMRFAGKWQSVCLLDIWSGQKKQLAYQTDEQGLRVNMTFSPTQSYLLLLSAEKTNEDCISLTSSQPTKSLEIPASSWEIERLDDNAITLDYAHWQEGDTQRSSQPMPVIAIQQRLNNLKYDGPLTLRYAVNVKQLSKNQKVHLVVEYPQRYRIAVNSQIVEYSGLPFWRDIRWLPIDIAGKLCDGENIIEMHCEQFRHGDLANVEDQKARYGTEIESIYLIGDFAVSGEMTDEKPVSDQWDEFGLPPIKVQCFDNKFCLTDNKSLSFGDTTVQGLPFYAGRLQLKAKIPHFDIDRKHRIFLRIERLDGAVADVLIDDQKVGSFVSHPLSVDVTEAVAQGGSELTIILYGTLRNLLGPHHHIDGELASVSPGHFSPTFKSEDTSSDILKWMNGKSKPVDWRDSYCMIGFGDFGQISFDKVVAG